MNQVIASEKYAPCKDGKALMLAWNAACEAPKKSDLHKERGERLKCWNAHKRTCAKCGMKSWK